MKTIILIVFLVLTVNIFAQVKVRGYYRSNGTYVKPHYRSNPDGNPYNNWSYPGNKNPYTGKVATGNPSTYLKNYFNDNERTTTNNQTQYSSASNSIYLPNNINENSATRQTTYSNGSNIIDLLREHISNKNYTVNVKSLNMRSGPSTSYPIFRSLSYNDNLTVIESYTNGWKKVEYKTYGNNGFSSSIIGFVSGNYISNSNLGFNNYSYFDNNSNYEVKEINQTVTPSPPVKKIQPMNSKEYMTSYNPKTIESSENHKFLNGDTYIGDFANGRMSGHGKYVWKNGDVYIGQFKDNNLFGYGILTKKNGEIIDGYFENGKLNGQGSIDLINGVRIVGLFKDGILNGYGSKIYAHEIKEKGYYVNGILTTGDNSSKNQNTSDYGSLTQNYSSSSTFTKNDTKSDIPDREIKSNINTSENKTNVQTKYIEKVNYYGRYLFWTTIISSNISIPLRENKDLNSNIIYECPPNCKVYVLEDLNYLQYKVFVNGKTGYLESKFLKPISK
jgi:hypothetical protein